MDAHQGQSLIDLKAISEPVVKLIDTVSNAVGIWYEPRKMKRIAKAENEVAKIKAEGQIELNEFWQRASERVDSKELRRQENIESITKSAISFLPESVNTEPVDEDWVYQFFDCCQDISNEQIQTLWAKILAGEVSEPNTFSLRTLHLVKTLGQRDAGLFSNFCNYIWAVDKDQSEFIHIKPNDTIDPYLSEKVKRVDMRHLESIGLIYTAEPDRNLHEQIYRGFDVWYGKTVFNIKRPIRRNDSFVGLYVHKLTPIGNELAKLRSFDPDEEYLNLIKNCLQKMDIEMTET